MYTLAEMLESIPVIVDNALPVTQVPPLRPFLDLVLAASFVGPDPLAIDDILQVENFAVTHDPFGDLQTTDGGFLDGSQLCQ